MRIRRACLGVVAFAAVLGFMPWAMAQEAPPGDPEAGRTVFNRQCMACHAVQAGQNKVGPSLAGVFGRHSGEAPKFNFSPAMKEANKTWDAATLDSYLADPRGYIPGARMIYAGLKDAEQRANVIAYIATLK
ncbi:c-type cytochrome [Pseudoroseomonas ludipueritiae]|uniref:Cytochrome c family protein n=1 Tax=Pseudoroseomonas ludipueritiae TaxID=198093 RepID=A0ABR7R8Q5_9PROT|nr:cytochrome c family protein [Pseudoroseomonas ludipueritiae]MBC9178189.1 cytochrome c family protein [Pseudoroseomonas ludipueritiae]